MKVILKIFFLKGNEGGTQNRKKEVVGTPIIGKELTAGVATGAMARLGVDSVLPFSSSSRFQTTIVKNPTVVPADDLKIEKSISLKNFIF